MTVSDLGDRAVARKSGAALTDGRPNRHDDGGMRTWSLTLARGAVVAALSTALLASSPAGAQTSDEKLDDFRARAEQGDADAQAALGLMYAYGAGVPEDHSEAVHWFRLAAEQGVATAQFNLGVSYSTGRGVPEDDREAMRWYRLAAEQGYADAQINLGPCMALLKRVWVD